MPRFFLADLRTGRQILDLPVLSGSWSQGLNTPETISAKVDLQDPDVRSLDLRNAASPCKAVLAVAEGDVVLAAGPVWSRSYDRDDATLSLSAKGMWSYFDHRLILPPVALTTDVNQFIVPDPADTSKTIANPALSTILSGLSLATIAKRLVQQAKSWTGGDVPVTFLADEAGTESRSFIGPEFKNVGDALEQLTKLENGPDIAFMPRFTGDLMGIEWVLLTGTTANPFLASSTVHHWDLTVPESSAQSVQISEDGTKLGSIAWLTGGRSNDTVKIARSDNATLVDSGFPLMEILDSSHSSISDQAVLDALAAEAALFGSDPTQVWSFEAEARQQPYIGSYTAGDYCDLTIAPFNPATGDGDPYLTEGGTFRHRIIGLSGDEKGNTVKIQCAPSTAD